MKTNIKNSAYPEFASEEEYQKFWKEFQDSLTKWKKKFGDMETYSILSEEINTRILYLLLTFDKDELELMYYLIEIIYENGGEKNRYCSSYDKIFKVLRKYTKDKILNYLKKNQALHTKNSLLKTFKKLQKREFVIKNLKNRIGRRGMKGTYEINKKFFLEKSALYPPYNYLQPTLHNPFGIVEQNFDGIIEKFKYILKKLVIEKCNDQKIASLHNLLTDYPLKEDEIKDIHFIIEQKRRLRQMKFSL